jgi:hypothetical protein
MRCRWQPSSAEACTCASQAQPSEWTTDWYHRRHALLSLLEELLAREQDVHYLPRLLESTRIFLRTTQPAGEARNLVGILFVWREVKTVRWSNGGGDIGILFERHEVGAVWWRRLRKLSMCTSTGRPNLIRPRKRVHQK